MRTAPPTVRMSQKAGPVFMRFPRTSGRFASVDAMLKSQRLRRAERVQVLPTPRVRGRLQKCRQRRPHRRAPIRTMQPLPPRMCPNCNPRRKTPPNPRSQAHWRRPILRWSSSWNRTTTTRCPIPSDGRKPPRHRHRMTPRALSHRSAQPRCVPLCLRSEVHPAWHGSLECRDVQQEHRGSRRRV